MEFQNTLERSMGVFDVQVVISSMVSNMHRGIRGVQECLRKQSIRDNGSKTVETSNNFSPTLRTSVANVHKRVSNLSIRVLKISELFHQRDICGCRLCLHGCHRNAQKVHLIQQNIHKGTKCTFVKTSNLSLRVPEDSLTIPNVSIKIISTHTSTMQKGSV